MRTHSTRSSQACLRMASTTLALAASFSRGATESSRSRNDMSAGTARAFSRQRSLEAGVEKQDRRGRFRLRWDMDGMLPVAPCPPPWDQSGSQVGGNELIGQELGEAGRDGPHETAAPAQAFEVSRV